MIDAATLPSLTGTSILVVDDNADFLELLGTTLQMCGARILAAVSVAQARAALEAVTPDLVICDLVLPDGTGTEFLEWLRGRPHEAGGRIATVAVTAFPRSYPARQVNGFAAYFVKPVQLDDLCRTIASLLGRAEVSDAPR
jgi:CheY-like chemotaxis protein